MRVDERCNRTDSRDAKPCGEVVGAVVHNETHDVAPRESLIQSPSRIAIRAFGQRAVAQRLIFTDERGSVAECLRQLVDADRQGPGWVLRKRSGEREGARPGLVRRVAAPGMCYR